MFDEDHQTASACVDAAGVATFSQSWTPLELGKHEPHTDSIEATLPFAALREKSENVERVRNDKVDSLIAKTKEASPSSLALRALPETQAIGLELIFLSPLVQ